jgi:hypothetical protein
MNLPRFLILAPGSLTLSQPPPVRQEDLPVTTTVLLGHMLLTLNAAMALFHVKTNVTRAVPLRENSTREVPTLKIRQLYLATLRLEHPRIYHSSENRDHRRE